MKVVWIITIFLVMFNIMVMFTNSLGIFQATDITTSMSEEEIQEYKNLSKNESALSVQGALGFEFDWSNIGAIIAGIITAAGAIGLAKWTHSPVPLGVGAFLAFTVAIWVKTYFVFDQFGVNQWLLTAGMVGMAIMLVATTSEEMSGGHNA